MNKELEKQLAVVFEQNYPGYEFFVEHVINRIFTEDDAYEALPVPEDYLTDENRQKANESGILRIDKVGTIDTEEPIEVFDVTLSDRKELQYNRVGIQQFIRSSLFPFTNAFMLFHNETTKDKDWRFSFAYKESTIKGMTSAKRYTYLFGKNHRARTASERFAKLADEEKDTQNLLNAFSVETLSKDFFNEYKNQYKNFCNFLFEHKSDTEYFGREFALWEAKYLRDYVKKMMGRITFIYFLQRKGWMNGDMEYMQNAFMRSSHQDDYLDVFLEPLFFGVLNTKPEERKDLFDQEEWDLSLLGEWKDVPYLNGGLFERDKQDKPKSRFPAEMFKELFDFYSRYNFTIDENDPDDAEIGVDPEMLGHIFENLLEDNKDKGAFYTPKEIVQYMSQESVAQYLKSYVQSDLHEAIDILIKHREVASILQKKDNAKLVYNILEKVKVCDPAIGSGAFPMGVLNVLFDSRLRLYPYTGNKEDFSWVKTKREIIQNNIYGVDIEKGAVDIARLRFWLALVVDENEPQPLPNLDYKIMCGDSLLYRFAFDVPFKDVLKDYNQKNGTCYSIEDYRQWVYDYTDISDHDQKDNFRKRIEDIKHAFKTVLSDKEKGKIAKVRGTIKNLQMADLFGGKKKDTEKQIKDLQKKLKVLEKQREEIENNKLFEHAFEWRFEFPALLNDDGVFRGFDIIIGNPPYGAKLSKLEKDIYKVKFSNVHMRTPETFCYFTSLAFKLCVKNSAAVVSYIVPNNIFFQNENEYTRKLLSLENMLVRAINLGDNTFENADVPTCVFVAKAKMTKDYNIAYSDYRDYNVKKIEWDESIENIKVEKLRSVPAMVIGMSNTDIDILNEIRNNGVTIDSIAEEMASGISTGNNEAFIINGTEAQRTNLERSLLKNILIGSDIDRFSILPSGDVIIYTIRDLNIDNYPNIKSRLMLYYDKLKDRSESREGILPWFSLGRSRYEQLFTEPKIIMRQTSDRIRCVYDNGGYYVLNSILVFKKKTNEYTYKYIASALNSKLTNYLYRKLTQEEGRTFAEVKPANVRKLYIPKATEVEQNLMSTLYDYMVFLRNPQSQSVDNVISNQFIGDFFESIIDGCVYELFFKEHMKERGINIFDFLYNMIKPIVNEIKISETIASVFNTLYKTDNEVRTRLNLFVSRSPEYLKNIIQS